MVRLSKMTDYAVVVLCQMAGDRGTAPFTAAHLAEATGLPLPSVSKLLKVLAQQGLVQAQRGAKGGYGLARHADRISAHDIIVAVEGPVALAACVEGAEEPCGFEATCPIRGRWDPVNAAVRGALSGVSLADMAKSVPETALLEV